MIDDRWVLSGRWSLIEPIGDKWVIWLCNPENLYAGLPAQQLTWICKGIAAQLDEPITKLDGEACLRVDPEAAVQIFALWEARVISDGLAGAGRGLY